MGKIQFQTREQKIILDEIKQSEFLRTRFYFTGGTALSAIYLHHRYSDDLDFFSEERFDNQTIFTLVEEWAKKNDFTLEARFSEVVYMFNLTFQNKTQLKVDFGYYPYKRVKQVEAIDGIEVDSLLDIAVNKLLILSQRTDVKDFVDLFFLLKKITVWDLIDGVKVKFRVKVDPLILGADFLKIDDFDYLPEMIKPLTLDTLKSFFRQKSKEIAGQSIK